MGLSTILFSFALGASPVEATPLKASVGACQARDATARRWEQEGHRSFSTQHGGWCVVARVSGQYWIAEQWSDSPTVDRRDVVSSSEAVGWRSKIPLSAFRDYVRVGDLKTFHFPDLASHLEVRTFHGQSVLEAHRADFRRLIGTEFVERAASDGVPLISRKTGVTLVSVPGRAGGSHSVSVVESGRK